MPVFKLLFLLFLTVPLAELYFLMQVGGVIGPLPTVLLCVFTAALGAILFRIQGIQTLLRAQQKLQRGELPADDVLGGLILLLCGLFLLTPGFATDVAGFLCLVPALRKLMAIRLLGYISQHHSVRIHEKNSIIEGEFEQEEDKRLH